MTVLDNKIQTGFNNNKASCYHVRESDIHSAENLQFVLNISLIKYIINVFIIKSL